VPSGALSLANTMISVYIDRIPLVKWKNSPCET
jgi:hypothetical protein